MTTVVTIALSKHFDQLMKVIAVQHENIADTTLSIEVDLELPRGYVAKIKIVIFEITSHGGPSIGTTVTDIDWDSALLRDPDDAVTLEIPENEVQHDVIADFCGSVIFDIDTTNGLGVFHSIPERKTIYFNEMDFDIVTARNLRFNVECSAQSALDIKCTIYYTLEKITSTEILELLDIL